MKLQINHEDNHIIVIEKIPGILSQGDISEEKSLLEIIKEYIKEKYNKPGKVFLGLVHRLDKPVSGLMVFAKTSKGAQRLSDQFAKKTISKYYIALIESKKLKQKNIEENQWNWVDNYLVRKGDKTSVCEKNTREAKAAKLKYNILESHANLKLILIKLETGRKHQIRCQLTNLMGPIIGDKKYGSTIDMGNGIALHAVHLAFDHPTEKKRLSFTAEIPKRFIKHMTIDKKGIMKKIGKTIDSDLSGQKV